MITHVMSLRYAGGHKLELGFNDGTSGTADLEQDLTGQLAPLRDQKLFSQAYLDLDTVCWPGEFDLAPEYLYARAHGLKLPESFEQVAENQEIVSLRRLRQELGITQAQLAEVVEMSQGDVSKMEAREDHRLSTLRRVVQGLGLELKVYAEGKGKRIRVA